MALFRSYTRADKVFADQFEATDDGNFVYRLSQKGAPIKVWSWERDGFIDAFVKARKRASWGLFGGMIALSVVATAIFGAPNDTRSEVFIYIGVGLAVVGFFIFWRWAWNAPSRALADRQPQGAALPKSDARRAGLKRMSWGQFAWSGLVVVIGSAKVASEVDVFSGWNRLWLVGGALFLARFIHQGSPEWLAGVA